MLCFLPVYGTTEGPLGFPMADADAKALDQLLDTLPEVDYRRLAVKAADPALREGERADISWITTEAPDRQREVVLAGGMDAGQFKANPIVTVAHDYSRQPVGRCLWLRKVREGTTRGVKAKTHYPERPSDWPAAEEWLPDRALALVRAGLMLGKSIGFLTLEASGPTPDEVRGHPEWADVHRVIRKWLLLEYACHWLPVNPEAVTEAVSKGTVTPDAFHALGFPVPQPKAPPPVVIPYRTADELDRSIRRRLAGLSADALAARAVEQASTRLTGGV